jgi:ornithine--oxo-acid transaminase
MTHAFIHSMSTDPDCRMGFGPYLEGVGPTYMDNGQIRTIRFGEISDIEHALALHGPNVAAFLVEPIQGEAGYACASFFFFSHCSRSDRHRSSIIVPEAGYLAKVHDLCKKHNVLLICDEIQTVPRFHSAWHPAYSSVAGSMPDRENARLRAR